MGLLADKVAIVTGAGRGIGYHTALLFAKEGAKVVVNDLGRAKDGIGEGDTSIAQVAVSAITNAGGQAVASCHDVADPAGAAAVVEKAASTFGGLDILVNNAGFQRDKPLLKMSVDEFDTVVAVHLRASFLCSQAAVPLMKKNGGCITNTTGLAGLLGNFGQSNYASAMAGICGLTRTCSIELQRFGIRVNAVTPLAKTRLTEDLPMFENVESMRPEHVAPLHLYLASSLGAEISGLIVSVAGGRLSTYRLVESAGKFKESADGVWTAEEIAEHFPTINGSSGKA